MVNLPPVRASNLFVILVLIAFSDVNVLRVTYPPMRIHPITENIIINISETLDFDKNYSCI
jgi:hypothetical protein